MSSAEALDDKMQAMAAKTHRMASSLCPCILMMPYFELKAAQYRGTLESISSLQAVMPPLTLLTYLNPCCRRKFSAFTDAHRLCTGSRFGLSHQILLAKGPEACSCLLRRSALGCLLSGRIEFCSNSRRKSKCSYDLQYQEADHGTKYLPMACV